MSESIERIWIDTETTGLDNRHDFLLEIAIVLTDRYGVVIDKFEQVIGYRGGNGNRLREIDFSNRRSQMITAAKGTPDAFVHEMHARSGLWDEVDLTHRTLDSVQFEAYEWLKHYNLPAQTFPMCGSTISFDRVMIQEYMPILHRFFHYRNIDISSIKELSKDLDHGLHLLWKQECLSEDDGKSHRALDDILFTIKEYRFYLDHNFIGNHVGKD